MRVRLRVPLTAVEAVVPPPMHIRDITGAAHPVGSVGNAVSNATNTYVIPPVTEAENVGRYIPPPKNPIWTPIPVGIRPTKPCAKC